jgi:hypothetical protein
MKGRGLSDSTVLKYYGAVEGVLSEWAQESEIISGSILDITSSSYFNIISARIRALPIFKERNSVGHHMYSSALQRYSEFLETSTTSSIEEDIDSIVTNPEIGTTEKVQLINSRIGQGSFRKTLVKYWGCCSVTGYPDTSLLVASHIKSWAESSNYERMDKFNGLLLVPNLDKVFDKGLISFNTKGNLLISPAFLNPEILGINMSMSVNLVEKHQIYMEYHRTHVFMRMEKEIHE